MSLLYRNYCWYSHGCSRKKSCKIYKIFDELKDPILFNELVYEEEIGSMILVSTDQCIKDDTDRAIMEKSVPVLKRSYM